MMYRDLLDKLPPSGVEFLKDLARGSAPATSVAAMLEALSLRRTLAAVDRNIKIRLSRVKVWDICSADTSSGDFSTELKREVEKLTSGKVPSLIVAAEMVYAALDGSWAVISPIAIEYRVKGKRTAWLALP